MQNDLINSNVSNKTSKTEIINKSVIDNNQNEHSLEKKDLFKYAYYGSIDGIENCLNENIEINSQDESGKTALHWAAVKYKDTAIEFLLRKGADPNIEDNYGQTPLHLISIINGKVDINLCKIDKSITLLISKMKSINIQDHAGCTPLHIAAYYCNCKTVAILLKNGADKTICDENGRTPFDMTLVNETLNYKNGMVLSVFLKAGRLKSVKKLLMK